VEAICTAYAYAPMLEALGCHVVGTDEMTGIQALERAAPTKPTRPGCPERREHEYIRHGTTTLIATRNVATGEILAPALGPTRTEVDFAAHIARVLDTDPDASWLFVADNLNTHQSAALVRLVADRCGLAADLGTKGRDGVLRSQASRAAFLANPAHRISFLYTPKHTSWLNQIELWFSILARRALTRGDFASTDALRARILAFIAHFNQTAQPFRWTYKGRPLCH
jgi:transposase